MGGIFQRDLDEPRAISLLSSPSLRGTSSVSRGAVGTERGFGSLNLLMTGLVLWSSEVSVEFRPMYKQENPLKI